MFCIDDRVFQKKNIKGLAIRIILIHTANDVKMCNSLYNCNVQNFAFMYSVRFQCAKIRFYVIPYKFNRLYQLNIVWGLG